MQKLDKIWHGMQMFHHKDLLIIFRCVSISRTRCVSDEPLLKKIANIEIFVNIFQFTQSDPSFTICFKYNTVLTILISWKVDVCTIPSTEAKSEFLNISKICRIYMQMYVNVQNDKYYWMTCKDWYAYQNVKHLWVVSAYKF